MLCSLGNLFFLRYLQRKWYLPVDRPGLLHRKIVLIPQLQVQVREEIGLRCETFLPRRAQPSARASSELANSLVINRLVDG